MWLVQRDGRGSRNAQRSSQHLFSVRHTRLCCKGTNKARHHFSWGRGGTLTTTRRATRCRFAAPTAGHRSGQPPRRTKGAEGSALAARNTLRTAQATAAQAHLLRRRAAERVLGLDATTLQNPALRQAGVRSFLKPWAQTKPAAPRDKQRERETPAPPALNLRTERGPQKL